MEWKIDPIYVYSLCANILQTDANWNCGAGKWKYFAGIVDETAHSPEP